jgi:CO/xanthine dehydrogenase FAD-binding subunit
VGPGSFSKIGTRSAMVISVASVCLQLDEDERSVRIALGSVAPTVIRAPEAEAAAASGLERAGAWDEPAASIPPAELGAFAELVAAAVRPIDDVRGTAAYRPPAGCSRGGRSRGRSTTAGRGPQPVPAYAGVARTGEVPPPSR